VPSDELRSAYLNSFLNSDTTETIIEFLHDAFQPTETKCVEVDVIQAGDKLEDIGFGDLYQSIRMDLEVNIEPMGAV
jgi:hypothetical protein